jgi:hypothetical protein
MSFTNNGDGTVTDKNTGLMWQQQDDGNTYNWYQASGTYDASYNPTSQDVCGALTTGSYTDWRLPSKEELISIVDYSIPYPGPTINPIFTNTKQYYYWSSTTGASYLGNAWYVYFSYGNIGYYYKDSSLYVRCVRGRQSGSFGNFDDNHNGTITDTSTGLMWQQSEPGGMPWSNALNYCENLELPSGSGQTDWRLPNIKELESITDDTIYNPAIDRNFFPNASASDYWSSTTVAGYPGYPWCVYFYDGYVDGGGYGYYDKGSSLYVRCVRGGQVGGSFDYYCDSDSDTYISSTLSDTCTGSGCVPVGCKMTPGDDCNDNDPLVNPGAKEGPYGNATCSDGKDNDCDGLKDASDPDCKSKNDLPDLTVTTVTVTPAKVIRGNSITVKDTTRNRGKGQAEASVTNYYLSSDNRKSKKDRLLTNNSVQALDATASSSGTTAVTIPADTRPGSYYIIACADDMKQVSESNEKNNCRASKKKIRVKK